MSEFKWRQFEGEIILWAVRWYCRYGISYRDLEQMMGEPMGSKVCAGDRKAAALAVASAAIDELASR